MNALPEDNGTKWHEMARIARRFVKLVLLLLAKFSEEDAYAGLLGWLRADRHRAELIVIRAVEDS